MYCDHTVDELSTERAADLFIMNETDKIKNYSSQQIYIDAARYA